MKTQLNFKGILILVFFSMFFIPAHFESKSAKIITGDEEYLIACEKMPSPVGGLEAIIKKIKYPDIARRAGVQGKVYVLVYINQNGDVDDVKLVKGLGAGCDEAAIEAVKSCKFSPGMDKGSPVKTKMPLPLTFKLS